MHLFGELHIAQSSKEEKQMVAIVGWPLLWAVQLATHAQLEAETQLRELDRKLRFDKDMQLSTTPFVSLALTDRVDITRDPTGQPAKLGRQKVLEIKV